ncbi:MAG: tetraacyldisaccharide 4'-kinase [Flaviramulus sp.]|nr:tetraacyldisaccharide 4'-kinase [Flaviramulus sp.]NNC49789.1 tetraacyldisaccharide 4'-kinase [Flaviramulus sp.]
MKLLRYILFPVVPVYFSVTWLRNKLYDLGIKESTDYNFPLICVGNLSVGGTGKSPMVEYLINLLKSNYNIATLSRGYKRNTKGFQLANTKSNAKSIGDEPFQFYSKFKNEILVAVDSNRRNGIEKLKAQNTEIILLDDAFQHRKVKAGLNILLTTFDNPYYNDIVLPTGNLREPKSGAKRANIIVVTKCPDNLNSGVKESIIKKIKPESYQHVFFSSIAYNNNIVALNSTKNIIGLEKFTLVTGIANATNLVNFLKDKGLNFEHLNFKDHHDFTPKDIDLLNRKELIVTTEKDFVRLKEYKSLQDKLYYLPIKVTLNNEIKFNDIVSDYLNN